MAEFHFLGVSEFKAAIEGSIARQVAATSTAVAKGAHVIEGKAKEELTKASHKRGTPTPSMAGQPPALVSGTLRRSVIVQGPKPTSSAGFSASIGPTAVYGRIQELGGMAGHSRLPPRPYMRPAVTKSATELDSLFKEAWSKW
ncbi:hypothetical protein [Amycolatopsis benzoatilytica]|uniref:hypothetical protein n=1 Tax=Amycolatopsis benzoatilytica TaxID=346045 RepID=UPI0003740BC1|nr:hypothetical protein [Amycolatopsis benzoatilytica]